MRDGLYSIVFTTTSGLLAQGACLIKEQALVGADFLHSYTGSVSGHGDELNVEMHCRRQPGGVSQFRMPEEFDLHWRGAETSYGFVAETPVPSTEVILLATAHYIETD